jgi:hypothetical protein
MVFCPAPAVSPLQNYHGDSSPKSGSESPNPRRDQGVSRIEAIEVKIPGMKRLILAPMPKVWLLLGIYAVLLRPFICDRKERLLSTPLSSPHRGNSGGPAKTVRDERQSPCPHPGTSIQGERHALGKIPVTTSSRLAYRTRKLRM